LKLVHFVFSLELSSKRRNEFCSQNVYEELSFWRTIHPLVHFKMASQDDKLELMIEEPSDYKNPYGPGEDVNLGTPTESLNGDGPMSPSHKVLHFLGSPIRFVNRKFAPGSMKGAVFTTMASTLGIGILSMPYAINL
jgi:hypothetical protein